MASNNVSIDISGLDAAIARLEAMPGAAERAIGKGLYAIALTAQADAQQLILKGPKTGVIYNLSNPKRRHQASAPGEAPANDLGFLVGSIRVTPVESNSVNLVAGAAYAVHLEYGTRNMAARPFLRPAAERAKEKGPGIIGAYVNAELKAT